MPARPVDQGDLKAVRGIGPKIESRLKAAAISTLDELARAPVNKLAAVLVDLRPSYDADRIRREQWQAQAATLTADTNRPIPPPAGSRRYRHNFTIEMQLDVTHDTVVATKVVHVQTGDEDTWSGWDPSRVITFIEDHAGQRSTKRAAPDGAAATAVQNPYPALSPPPRGAPSPPPWPRVRSYPSAVPSRRPPSRP